MFEKIKSRGLLVGGFALGVVALGVAVSGQNQGQPAEQDAAPLRDTEGLKKPDQGGQLTPQGEIDETPDWARPEWVDCPIEPSWWDQLTECRDCSPGFIQGPICFDTGVTVACDAGASLTFTGAASISVQVPCGSGLVQVGYSWSRSQSKDCDSEDCEMLELILCYPMAQIRVWECSKLVPVEWHPNDGPAIGNGNFCPTPTRFERRTWLTTEFIPNGPEVPECKVVHEVMTASGPVSIGCWCKETANQNCQCDESEMDVSGGIGHLIAESNQSVLLDDVDGMSAILFDASQLGSDFGVPAPSSIKELTLSQISTVQFILNRAWVNAINPDHSAFMILFENGDSVIGTMQTMTMMLDYQYESIMWDNSRLDFNFDGKIDLQDDEMLLNAYEGSMAGYPVSSIYDIDGDGVVCGTDLKRYDILRNQNHSASTQSR